jgi:RNA polymerase sigma-70 factor (ECF subfamily)
MSDGEMVRRALAGDAAAYGQLARRWAARVLAVCHARTRDRHAAEDLAQDALLRGMRALPTLAEPEKFGSWVVGIAVRTCLDWLKSPKRGEVSFEALAGGTARGSAGVAPDDAERQAAGERREQAERLTREVERLPQPYREVLMLYYYRDGCTYRELAELLGVSAATINARLTKARQMLRGRMMSACESHGDSESETA